MVAHEHAARRLPSYDSASYPFIYTDIHVQAAWLEHLLMRATLSPTNPAQCGRCANSDIQLQWRWWPRLVPVNIVPNIYYISLWTASCLPVRQILSLPDSATTLQLSSPTKQHSRRHNHTTVHHPTRARYYRLAAPNWTTLLLTSDIVMMLHASGNAPGG